MAHDYKRNAAYKPKTKIPGWLTFLTGLAIGLLAAFLLYLKQQNEPERVPAATTTTPAPPTDPKDTAATPPRFDFYTILPEQEVIIPDQEVKETKPAKSPETVKPRAPANTPLPPTASSTPPVPTGKKGNYMVQVGAFKKAEEADRLRAALALLGIESTVQVVRIGDTDSFHRVRVGPFEDIVTSLADWPWPDEDDEAEEMESAMPHVNPLRDVGRNDPCPCGSGKKYKKCCLVTA